MTYSFGFVVFANPEKFTVHVLASTFSLKGSGPLIFTFPILSRHRAARLLALSCPSGLNFSEQLPVNQSCFVAESQDVPARRQRPYVQLSRCSQPRGVIRFRLMAIDPVLKFTLTRKHSLNVVGKPTRSAELSDDVKVLHPRLYR